MQEQQHREVLPCFKAYKNKIVLYPSYEQFGKREKIEKPKEDKPNTDKFKGYMSKHTRSKIMKIVENWQSAIEQHMRENGVSQKYHYKYMNFVTLTLSAKQAHSDQYIKRNMLNRFLQEMKRHRKVTAQLWVAEAQKNGNIHFHILVNKPIRWVWIQAKWNEIQDTHGYIDRFEIKHGHRSPNSTDIHKLNKVHNISNYISKYLTKSDSKRLIDGRLWSCSRNLRDTEVYSGLVDSALIENISRAVRSKKAKEYKGDYFTVITVNTERDIFKDSRYHKEGLKKQKQHNYDKIYLTEEQYCKKYFPDYEEFVEELDVIVSDPQAIQLSFLAG